MSVNEKMTALANEVRELSGTESAKSIDAMTSDIDAANTEINEQTGLIEQIVTALENKAAGGATPAEPVIEALSITENGTYSAPIGVDGYSPITVNVSGGDAQIKTCTVTISTTSSGASEARICGYSYTAFENGEIVVKWKSSPVDHLASAVISDVVCGSAITVMLKCLTSLSTYHGDVMVASFDTWGSSAYPVAVLCAPNIPGSSSSIIFDCDD